MTNSDRFDLQFHVDQLTRSPQPRLAFKAESRAEFDEWQQALRDAVLKLLGLEGRERPASVTGVLVQAVEREGYNEEKYAVDVGEGVQAPVYVLVPQGEPPFKPIMVFHGHNPNVQYVLGNYPSAEIAQEMRSKDNNYAQALAQAGYLAREVPLGHIGQEGAPQEAEPARQPGHLADEQAAGNGRAAVGAGQAAKPERHREGPAHALDRAVQDGCEDVGRAALDGEVHFLVNRLRPEGGGQKESAQQESDQEASRCQRPHAGSPRRWRG